MLLLLLFFSCSPKIKIKSVEGYIYDSIRNPAAGIQVCYPLKVDRSSWIYNELAVTDKHGFFKIEALQIKSSKNWLSIKKGGDSITINFYLTRKKDIDLSEEKQLPKEYNTKKKLTEIINLDTIYINYK